MVSLPGFTAEVAASPPTAAYRAVDAGVGAADGVVAAKFGQCPVRR